VALTYVALGMILAVGALLAARGSAGYAIPPPPNNLPHVPARNTPPSMTAPIPPPPPLTPTIPSRSPQLSTSNNNLLGPAVQNGHFVPLAWYEKYHLKLPVHLQIPKTVDTPSKKDLTKQWVRNLAQIYPFGIQDLTSDELPFTVSKTEAEHSFRQFFTSYTEQRQKQTFQKPPSVMTNTFLENFIQQRRPLLEE
jgi:hypothetical protein